MIALSVALASACSLTSFDDLTGEMPSGDAGDAGAPDAPDAEGGVIDASPVATEAGDATTSATRYANEVKADRPIAYWPLDELPGATAATDTVAPRDGVYVGSPTLGVPGPFGQGSRALRLDGVKDYVVNDGVARLGISACPSSRSRFGRRSNRSPARLTSQGSCSPEGNFTTSARPPSDASFLIGSSFDPAPDGGPRVRAEFLPGKVAHVALYDRALPAARVKAHFDARL